MSELLSGARGLFGTLHDLDAAGVAELRHLLERGPDLGARIVLSVFPACRTTAVDLVELLALQDALGDHVLLRVLPASSRRTSSTTMLCAMMADGQTVVASGPTAPFGAEAGQPGQANIVADCEPVLRDRLCRWFDEIWELAVPLNAETALPRLSPMPASEAAAAAWKQYATVCADAAGEITQRSGSGDEIESGAPAASHVEEPRGRASESSVTASLNFPRIDEVAEEVSRITRRGLQVAIDGTTRIPPLSTPIAPDLFGLEANRQLGSIRRETRYRIDAFDAKTQKAIESRRTRLSDILRRLSFSLGDGVYWIPRAAIPLLEREVERVNTEGADRLREAVGDNLGAYLEQQRGRIITDAERAYREFRPDGALPKGVVDTLLVALRERLAAAGAGRFLPQLSYSDIRFRITATSPSASSWGQPLTLLHSIAQFPRKVLTDRRHLLGIEVDENELLPAMNVAEDELVTSYLRRMPVRERADRELGLLDVIMESKASARARCEAILRLLRGDPAEAIRRPLDTSAAASKHDAPASATVPHPPAPRNAAYSHARDPIRPPLDSLFSDRPQRVLS